MDVFFTSTASGSLGKQASSIYMQMESRLKRALAQKNYGPGLPEWFLMFVILSPDTPGRGAPERVMFKKKTKELDLRLNVDFEAFKKGDEVERRELLYDCMLRSLDLMATKKIPDFDAVALKADVEAIAAKEGWDTAA